MTVPTQQILTAFLAGMPVTLTRTAEVGARHGADAHRYGTVRLDGATVYVPSAGRGAWRTLATLEASRLNAAQREWARMARLAVDSLALASQGAPATATEGYAWLVALRCAGTVRNKRGDMVPCGEWLTRPLYIMAGKGPVCSGYQAKLERKRAERSALAGTFAERMAARLKAR